MSGGYVSPYQKRVNQAAQVKAELWQILDEIYPDDNWPVSKRSTSNPVLPPAAIFRPQGHI